MCDTTPDFSPGEEDLKNLIIELSIKLRKYESDLRTWKRIADILVNGASEHSFEDSPGADNMKATRSLSTLAALEARQENKLAVWKELFPCMVRIYAHMEQGRTYTRKEVAELFQGEGVDVSISKAGKITDARLDYFWKLFTNSGRPIADLSKCGSPDVSAATLADPLSTITDPLPDVS